MPKSFLPEMKDNLGKEGKRRRLADIPLFSVFAVPEERCFLQEDVHSVFT